MAVAQQCWESNPADRPSIHNLSQQLREIWQKQSEHLPPMRDVGAVIKDAMPKKQP